MTHARTRVLHPAGGAEGTAGAGNLAGDLAAVAARVGERTALALGESELTYRALETASARVAALLRRRGLEPGDRVGLMLPSVPEFAVVYYGVLRAGGVVVPLSARLAWRDVAHYLGYAGARLLFAWHAFAEPAEEGARGAGADCLFVTPEEFPRLLAGFGADPEICPRLPWEVAAIVYPPDPLGRSRGAALTHDNLRRNAAAVRRLHGLTAADVVLAPLPLFRCFGQTCALGATLGAGARLELMERFDARRALDLLERAGVTSVLGVPSTFAALLEARTASLASGPGLRVSRSRGGGLPEDVRRRFEAAFGGAVLEGYGLSEASPLATSTRPDRPRRAGSAGTPIDGVEVVVVDAAARPAPPGQVGDVLVRGHNVMRGYWRDPEATGEVIDAAGFLRTGARGHLDKGGELFVVERGTGPPG